MWLKEFGGPEVLVMAEAPEPVVGPGRALVEVEHANITFVETQFRAGLPGPFKAVPPVIPGNGVGGVVSEVGEGVDPALVGKRVVSSTGGRAAMRNGRPWTRRACSWCRTGSLWTRRWPCWPTAVRRR
ncbi:alcohol dehydrogenase catalytic domain-containing protein [Actinomadura yumaensis]|uniref:alcohol dehydrogenase catalytic domain-containing protein n=1 Tax=Actinomadura yumaensis TaxID=111807 RepID=UPI00360E2635